MITIFSCPKPFKGRINIIQKNAICSWTHLQPRPQIVLMGDEQGTAEVCQEFGLQYVPNVKRNEFGTPLIDSIFEIGQKQSTHSLVCYINSDVILMNDFIHAIRRMSQRFDRFLAVSRRWDIDISRALKFTQEWRQDIKNLLKRSGRLQHHSAIDCFIFPKGLFETFPCFALGRPFWDNWLIYNAQTKKIPVVDLTEMVSIVHQSHDYSHYKLKGSVWGGPEAQEGLRLIGGYRNVHTILDADYKLTKKGLKKNFLKYFFKFLRKVKVVYHRYIKRNPKW